MGKNTFLFNGMDMVLLWYLVFFYIDVGLRVELI